MQFLFIGLIILVAASFISKGMSSDADVKLAIYNSEAQIKLDAEQRAILVTLESKNDATVSQFVSDWREAYPSATTDSLTELGVIQKKIDQDIKNAKQFTLAWHSAKADELNSKIDAPFAPGFKVRAKPGL